jgi:hypothetical protein
MNKRSALIALGVTLAEFAIFWLVLRIDLGKAVLATIVAQIPNLLQLWSLKHSAEANEHFGDINDSLKPLEHLAALAPPTVSYESKRNMDLIQKHRRRGTEIQLYHEPGNDRRFSVGAAILEDGLTDEGFTIFTPSSISSTDSFLDYVKGEDVKIIDCTDQGVKYIIVRVLHKMSQNCGHAFTVEEARENLRTQPKKQPNFR